MAFEKRGVFSQLLGVLGLVFGIFFLIGAIFVGVGWMSWQSAEAFRAKGVDVAGQVEKRWESTRECKDSNSDVTRTCTDFNVGYSYEVAGRVMHGSTTTDYDTYANLPEDPGNAVTSLEAGRVDASGGMGVLALVFGGLGGVFFVIGAGGLVWLVRRALAATRLRDNGTARGAVVVAQEETNVRVNNRQQWRIRWKDDTGVLGASRGQAREKLPQVGDRITVYADPDGKLPPVWEGDSGTR